MFNKRRWWCRSHTGCATIVGLMIAAAVACMPVGTGGGAAWAQPPDVPPPPDEKLTVQSVTERIKQIEADTSLAEELKTRLLELYQQALNDLGRAEEWAGRSAEFDNARQEAPTRLQSIQTELATPPVEPVPEVPEGASLGQLEQRLAQVEAELKAARENAASLDQERKRRADRRAELPAATTAARQKLEEVTRDIEALSGTNEPPEVVTARRMALQARRNVLEKELAAYEAEIASYDARGELHTARRDKAAREIARLESLFKSWQGIVGERRRAEAAKAAEEAQKARRKAAQGHPVAARIAKENAVWAERRAKDALADKIDQAGRKYESVKKALAETTNDFANITSKVKVAGLTHAMGQLLRRERERLPSPREHLRNVSERKDTISHIQVELIELEEQRRHLVDELESMVQAALAEALVTSDERAELETAVRELLQARRGYIEALTNDYNSYLNVLVDLDGAERRLIWEVEKFRDYIDKRVLWIKSVSLPRFDDLENAVEALAWLTSLRNWGGAARATAQAVQANAVLSAVLLLAVVVLFGAQGRLRTRVRLLGEAASKATARDISESLFALAWTALIAVRWPAILWVVGWSLSFRLDGPEFARAVGAGIRAAAAVLLLGESFRQLCRVNGLGPAHFGWPARSAKLARRNLAVLLVVALLIVFVVTAMDAVDEITWRNSLGRFAFIIGQVVLAGFAARVLHPRSGVLQEHLKTRATGWLSRSRHLWYALAVVLPLALAALAATGFYYTALELTMGAYTTAWFILGLVVLNGVALRWLLVSRRKLAFEQARKRWEARGEQGAAGGGESTEPRVDLTSLSAQTRNLLRTGVATTFFVGLWFVWGDVLPALGILDTVEVWSVTEKVSETVIGTDGVATLRWVEKPQPITLADLGLALLIFMVTVIAGRNLPGLLEIAILQRLPFKAGERYAIVTIARYTITLIGLVVGFGIVGIGWAKVQWLAAAMVVGLGFGLQEIFANFVSGLILLFERPIRVGDTVTVGGISGNVTRIQIRATTITDWDRKELIIPNKEFVTGQVVNWSLSDSIIRVVVPVGIAYGSDTHLAEELLYRIAREHEGVLSEPEPSVFFLAFGESSLDFELRVFVPSVAHLLQVKHGLHMVIDQEFRRAGIEIAFPQRDVHVRSIPPELPVRRLEHQAEPTEPREHKAG